MELKAVAVGGMLGALLHYEWEVVRNTVPDGSASSLGPASSDLLRVADRPEEAGGCAARIRGIGVVEVGQRTESVGERY